MCLIKSVINELSLFYMSFFKASKQVCKIIKLIQINFLWGWGSEGKKISWVAWNNICLPVEAGRLGIRDMHSFNVALLAKWKWRLGLKEVGEWKDVIKSRYGDWRDMATSIVDRKSSYWWKDLG